MTSGGRSFLSRLTGQVETIRGGCKKCGQVGHLTHQCRNFIKISENSTTDALLDISSTSSESGDESDLSSDSERESKARHRSRSRSPSKKKRDKKKSESDDVPKKTQENKEKTSPLRF
eukprot:Colp12_sorted_trinity150504_noHs@9940